MFTLYEEFLLSWVLRKIIFINVRTAMKNKKCVCLSIVYSILYNRLTVDELKKNLLIFEHFNNLLFLIIVIVHAIEDMHYNGVQLL